MNFLPTSVGKSEMVVSETKRYIQPSMVLGFFPVLQHRLINAEKNGNFSMMNLEDGALVCTIRNGDCTSLIKMPLELIKMLVAFVGKGGLLIQPSNYPITRKQIISTLNKATKQYFNQLNKSHRAGRYYHDTNKY